MREENQIPITLQSQERAGVTAGAGPENGMSILIVDHEVAVFLHDAARASRIPFLGHMGAGRPDRLGVELQDLRSAGHDVQEVRGEFHIVDDIEDEVSVVLHREPKAAQWREQAFAGTELPPGSELGAQVYRYSRIVAKLLGRGKSNTWQCLWAGWARGDRDHRNDRKGGELHIAPSSRRSITTNQTRFSWPPSQTCSLASRGDAL